MRIVEELVEIWPNEVYDIYTEPQGSIFLLLQTELVFHEEIMSNG